MYFSRYSRLLGVGLGTAFLLPVPVDAAAPASSVLQEVVVTGTRSPHLISEAPVETLVITREEIERTPAANLPQLLKTLPGVSASLLDDNLASDNLRLTMRGMQIHDGYGLILIDGRRTHGGLGGHGEYGVSLNQVPLNMIERIEVVKGGSSALYGSDAMAGVINIITKSVPSTTEGSTGIRYGVYNVLPREGDSVKSSTRRQAQVHASGGMPVGDHSGLYLHIAHQSDDGAGNAPQTSQREMVQGKWDTRLNSSWSVDAGAYLSRSRQDTPAGVDASYSRQHDEYRVNAGVEYREGEHSWRFSTYHYNNDFESGYAGNPHGWRYGEVGYTQAESVYTYFGERHWLTVGLEAQRQGIDYFFTNNPEAPHIPVRQDVDTYSVFVQDEIWLLNQRLILVPGFRYEDHSRFGGEFNPKVTASYRTDYGTTWRASLGRAFKSPTMRQLYYGDLYLHSTTNYIRSNPELNPETALSYQLSAEQTLLDGRFWGSLGIFKNDISDMVIQSDTNETYLGLPITSYANVQKAEIQGIEANFRTVLGQGLTLKGGATFSWSENKDTGKDLPYLPKYTFSLTPSYQLPDGKTGIDMPIMFNGAQYRNQTNTQEVDAHQVLDLRVWHLLGEHLTAALEINNIFDSHKGDEAFSPRQGRGVSMSLTTRF
jgi:outer membrane receptor for ferrienterochelin and colicins